MATICWASTSRLFCGAWVGSTSPSSMARVMAAISSRSSRWVGKKRPSLVWPTRWPERPTRCNPRATPLADWSCTTRSTDPMSMPSSSDEVPTSAGRLPSFSARSNCSRASRLMLPWWARNGPVTAPVPWMPRPLTAPPSIIASAPSALPERRLTYRSFSRSAARSAWRRLLAKISVVRWASIRSITRGMMAGQMLPPGRSLKSSTAVITFRSIALTMPASTMVTGLGTSSPSSQS